jgi:putative thioredoxin
MALEPGTTILEVREADFDREVIERSLRTPVVVDFWAPWCAPCRALAPALAALAEEWAGAIALAKVDIDQAPGLARRFAVRGIPAVKIFRDGAVVDEFLGALPASAIRERLRKILPTEADRWVEEAARLAERDPAAAEARYQKALSKEPDNAAARIGLAGRLLARGERDEADRLLEDLAVDGPLEAEAEKLRARSHLERLASGIDEAANEKRLREKDDDAQALYRRGVLRASRGDHAGALDDLLRAAQSDRQLAATEVRDAMVRVFHLAGIRSELADDYRKRLAAILY